MINPSVPKHKKYNDYIQSFPTGFTLDSLHKPKSYKKRCCIESELQTVYKFGLSELVSLCKRSLCLAQCCLSSFQCVFKNLRVNNLQLLLLRMQR